MPLTLKQSDIQVVGENVATAVCLDTGSEWTAVGRGDIGHPAKVCPNIIDPKGEARCKLGGNCENVNWETSRK